eukprot:TRINITY_DN9093_c0_g1_i2.p1 TRINITY_DN9093_c0_g1~~TRINITY_DN9093_c0_g1_i2.p1  ORF type:complete len:348 (-),score=91.82 TRINITY_DN9093_c0_g1_i2:206-1249(-)
MEKGMRNWNVKVLGDASRRYDTERKVIRNTFTRKEHIQTKQYIKDLEHNLSVNKEIINELTKKNLKDSQYKTIIERLNKENATLQLQVRNTLRERDDIQAKLLLAEQVTINYKVHEQDAIKEVEQSKLELVDQLNRKEYAIQRIEQKYQRALEIMRELVHREPVVKRFFDELKDEGETDCKVTNVVEVNNQLKIELTLERQKVQKLAEQVIQQGLQPCVPMKKYLTMGNDVDGRAGFKMQMTETDGECGSRQEYVVREEPAVKLKATSNFQVEQLKSRVKELYGINERLSKALKCATGQLQTLPKHGRSRNGNMGPKTCNTVKPLLDLQGGNKEAEQGKKDTKLLNN